MTERDPLDHAREQYGHARTELKQREWDLALQVVTRAQEQLEAHETALKATRELLQEIPEQPSLDHSATKRDAIKELEDMERRVAALRHKIFVLRGVHQ
jgi:hypothetical protein